MRFYLTTAIDYVNSRPHLGTAYEKITADVIARYKRLSGVETRFLMGNDEHSQNVFRKARELGLDPHVYCDQMETAFREVWARLHWTGTAGILSYIGFTLLFTCASAIVLTLKTKIPR